jgi:hypothetical protein
MRPNGADLDMADRLTGMKQRGEDHSGGRFARTVEIPLKLMLVQWKGKEGGTPLAQRFRGGHPRKSGA